MDDLLELRIFDTNKRFGRHTGLDGSLFDTIDNQGCSCCQVFLTQQSYTPKFIPKKERDRICDLCLKFDKTCYIHCPYVINLASENTEIREKGKQSVLDHLKTTEGFPCCCVLHTGSGKISTVAETLNSMDIRSGEFKRSSRPLLLEVCAGEGKKIGKDDNEIRKLFESLDHPDSKIGLCLDTQHLFASGFCDFSSHESVVKMYDQFEDVVGSGGIGMIHINDSMVPFGSKKDRHAPLGIGYIWNRDFSSLCSLIQCVGQIDTVLETQISNRDINILCEAYKQFI